MNATTDSECECIYFCGEGYDSIERFTVTGTYSTRTSVMSAIKAYATHWWEWRRMVTLFGMAGMWGPGWSGGWWWIWLQEWSPATTRWLN